MDLSGGNHGRNENDGSGNAGPGKYRHHHRAVWWPVIQDRQPVPDPCGPGHVKVHAGRPGGTTGQ